MVSLSLCWACLHSTAMHPNKNKNKIGGRGEGVGGNFVPNPAYDGMQRRFMCSSPPKGDNQRRVARHAPLTPFETLQSLVLFYVFVFFFISLWIPNSKQYGEN